MSWDPSDDADDFWEEDTEEQDEDGEGNPDPEDAFIGWYWEG